MHIQKLNFRSIMDYKEIVDSLIKSGAKRYTDLTITNISLIGSGFGTRYKFTVQQPILGYSNIGEKIETNTLFYSLGGVVCALRESEDYAWLGDTLLSYPKALPLIANGAKIDVLQLHYYAGEKIYNPFINNTEQTPNIYSYNVYINNVIDFRPSKFGEMMIDKIADKIMGF